MEETTRNSGEKTSKTVRFILSETLNRLVYTVERGCLIHRQSGLLLCHAVFEGLVTKDADMVSGMLTAIQDFDKDSFGGDESSALEFLRVGEFTIWIEQSPSMIMAAVIRGDAPAPFVVLVNKCDLVDQWRMNNEDLENLSIWESPIINTSAKTGEGVEKAFSTLARRILSSA